MNQPYTFEEILLLLERTRMDDVSQRLRELWKERVCQQDGTTDCAKTTTEGLDGGLPKDSALRKMSAEEYEAWLTAPY